MAANASAHKLRITIGSEDWSRSLVSFDAGQDQRSMNGLILTTGTIVLGTVLGMPGSLNPRSASGRTRWWRGQVVQIWCTNSSGQLVKHRFGHLYILKAPLPPQDGKITLELGCILSLRNFAQPDDDKSGVEPGISTDRRTIVNSLLFAAGCPACVDSIEAFPLNTPQPKQGGSYVEQAGIIAYGGLKSLYQDGNGQIRAASNNLNQSGSVATIAIGHDEISYEPSEGSETPCEVIKCVGVEKTLIDNWTTEKSIVEEYGPAAVIDPKAGISPVLLRRIETVDITNKDGKKRTELILAPAGKVMPSARPKDLRIILDSYTEETHYYQWIGTQRLDPIESSGIVAINPDQAKAPKLEKVVTVVERLFPAAAPEFFESLEDRRKDFWRGLNIIASRTELEYRYTNDELIERTVQTTRETRAAIVGAEDTFSPANLDISEVQVVQYQRKTPRIGKKIDTLEQVLARAFPDLEDADAEPADRIMQKLAIVTKSRKEEFSNAGQCNPPQAERKPERWTEEEKPIEATARFAIAPLNSQHQERERTIQLDFGAVSKGQLEQIAQIKGTELIGQAQGVTLQVPLLDTFLSGSNPFMLLDVVEPDGTVLKVLTNGIQISHDPTSAIAGFTGIWLGSGQIGQPARFEAPYYTIEASAPLVVPIPPIVRISHSGGAKAGGIGRLLPYLPQTSTIVRSGGAKAGGRDGGVLSMGDLTWAGLTQQQWEMINQQEWENLS